jgi:hypothetical protein
MGLPYIPRKDKDFQAWVINFLKYLYLSLPRFGFPSDEYVKLTTQRDDFVQKLEIADEPATRTQPAVLAKDRARELLEVTIRQDVKEYLQFNRNVTDEDRAKLGLPIYKTEHTPAPVAETYPWTKVLTDLIRHLKIEYGSGENSRAKLAGQHGVEVAAVISDEKPTDIGELVHSYFSTHSPLDIEFKEEDRGKTFWFAIRWENTRGVKGPWSAILSVVIP